MGAPSEAYMTRPKVEVVAINVTPMGAKTLDGV